jgi:Tfp pilus assembly protein PilE
MLVVIAIIGILAAILIPAVQMAVTKARNAAITDQISQLEMAVEKYLEKHSDYPPNFNEDYVNTPWPQTIVFRHLRRVSRNAGENMTLWTNYANGDPLLGDGINLNATPYTQIDAAECLVFWLGGLSASAASPTTGGNGPLEPVSSTEVQGRRVLDRAASFFEFKESQLGDIDGDGLFEYYPPYGDRVPYVYFDGRSYDNLGARDDNANSIWDDDDAAQYPPPNSPLIAQFGIVRPYVVGVRTVGGNTVPVFAHDKKFQIISAGLDGRYSSPANAASFGLGARKLFYTDVNQSQLSSFTGSGIVIYGNEKEDLDNIANFSGGLFGDKRPD